MVLPTRFFLPKYIHPVLFDQLEVFHTEKHVLQTENNSTGQYYIHVGQKFIFHVRELVSGKNITWPLMMSLQVARSRNSQAIPERPSAEETSLGESTAQIPPGKERTSQGQEGKKRKPREILGCLLQHPLSFTSTNPEQMPLDRREYLAGESWESTAGKPF